MALDRDRLDPDELEDVTRSLIVVYRGRFQLRVYKRERDSFDFKARRRFPIALGAQGYATPAGVYVIRRKAFNPDWYIPDSDWVDPKWRESYAPEYIIPGGDPANPITGAFMALTEDGVGIHGTANLESLGTRASHGCIRASTDDAVWVYRHVPVGTPVVIT